MRGDGTFTDSGAGPRCSLIPPEGHRSPEESDRAVAVRGQAARLFLLVSARTEQN